MAAQLFMTAASIIFSEEEENEQHLRDEMTGILGEVDVALKTVVDTLAGQQDARIREDCPELVDDLGADVDVEGGTSTASSNPYLLKSKDGSIKKDVRRILCLFNRWIQGGGKNPKDRDLRIIFSSVTSSVGGNNGKASGTYVKQIAELGTPTPGRDVIGLGSYIVAMFNDPKLVYKLYLGKIVGMTNRPSGQGKAEKWRKDVSLDEVPATLFCRADWFAPYVPKDNPHGYDSVTTPHYVWNPAFALDHNNREFEASTIVISPHVEFHEDSNTYEISNGSLSTGDLGKGEWTFCLDYVEGECESRKENLGARDDVKKRKAVADRETPTIEEPAAPVAPIYSRIAIEDADIEAALHAGNSVPVMTTARSATWVLATLTKRIVEDDESIVYHVKFDTGSSSECELHQLGKVGESNAPAKRTRQAKKLFSIEK